MSKKYKCANRLQLTRSVERFPPEKAVHGIKTQPCNAPHFGNSISNLNAMLLESRYRNYTRSQGIRITKFWLQATKLVKGQSMNYV